MSDHQKSQQTVDPFLLNYDAAEIRIAAEFLSNWLPFLSRGLCQSCIQTLSHGIQSLYTGDNFSASTPSLMDLTRCKEGQGNYSESSTWLNKGSARGNGDTDTHSLGSWKDEGDGLSEHAAEACPTSETWSTSSYLSNPRAKKSWADMAQQDDLAAEEESDLSGKFMKVSGSSSEGTSTNEVQLKVVLSRDQREHIRFHGVQRKANFICLERVNRKFTNILEGLELHTGVFSAAEQKRIVSYVEEFLEMGRTGQLKEHTYSAPQKWMRGKGRVTLQFGCCYNYATDKYGNPPGILKNGIVDSLPHLFKVMIKRLVRWHVLPLSCVPDSCIVNIYEEGDCIPPHIDNHDFLRPFCTISFLSECEIVFGSNLKIVGAGEFAGSYAIPLPVGSVLVLNGNGADVAKHCVPAVPSKRISITFRKMDESKWPAGYAPEPDLQGLEPLLPDDVDIPKVYNNAASRPRSDFRKPTVRREERVVKGRVLTAEPSDAQYSGRIRLGPAYRRRFQVNLEE